MGELEDSPFIGEGEVNDHRVVKLHKFKVVITQSSHDFIKITFSESNIKKLIQQLLLS